jgi:hypothetical protein
MYDIASVLASTVPSPRVPNFEAGQTEYSYIFASVFYLKLYLQDI